MMMSTASLVMSILSTVDVDELLHDLQDLADGASPEEEVALVAHLLDAAVPEELAGQWADAAMAPVYEEAAGRVVRVLHRRLERRRGAAAVRPTARAERLGALVTRVLAGRATSTG